MNKRKILASLSEIANNLDLNGKTNEADTITKVMLKVSNVFDEKFNDMVRRDTKRTPGRSERFERDLPGELDDRDFDDDYYDDEEEISREELERAFDEGELSDYSFSGEDDDFEDDDDDIINEFDYEMSPGRFEDFESDMPGEMPDLDENNLDVAISREVERRMKDASDQEKDQLTEDIKSAIVQMIKDARM